MTTTEMQQPLTLNDSQQSTLSLADFHAKLSAWLEKGEDLKKPEAHYFLISLGLQPTKDPLIWYSKTSKVYLIMGGGQTFETILGVLSELGYDTEWQLFNSKDWGVPQNLERVYIVGHLRNECRSKIFPLTREDEATADDTSRHQVAIPVLTPDRIEKRQNGRRFKEDGEPSFTVNTVDRHGVMIGAVNHGSFRDTGENANTILATYHKGPDNHGQRPMVRVGTLRTHNDGKGFREMRSGDAPTIPARAREDGSGQAVILVKEATKAGYAEAHIGDSINISVPNSKTRRGRVQREAAGTLQTIENQVVATEDYKIRRLTPVECERLQGFPDNWTVGSDTQRYKQCGNAVTVNVVAAVMKGFANHVIVEAGEN